MSTSEPVTVDTEVGEPISLVEPEGGEPVALSWLTVGKPVQTMLTPSGVRVWIGTGAPGIVPGAKFGDHYIDEATGILYVLG